MHWLNYDIFFCRAQDLIKTLDSEIAELKINNKDLVAEMDACRRRETDKLELTAKLSRKNAELQSENTNLSNKVNKDTQIHNLKISSGFQQCGILTSVDSEKTCSPLLSL